MRSVFSRARRFLFWTLLLLVGAYISWGRIEAWRLSRAIADIHARGEPVDYGYWYAKQVTAEQRESARLYGQAAGYAVDAESGQQYRSSQIDVDVATGPVLTFAEITATYRPDAPAMQLLDRATPMDFTEFGEESRELYDNQIPLQALGAQACLRADVTAARGDGEAAARALIPCMRLQRTLSPFYRSQHSARLLGSLRILFRHTSPSDRSLAQLQSALAAWPEEDGAVRALMQQRVRFISHLDTPRRSFGEFLTTTLAKPFLTSVTRGRLLEYDQALAVARLPQKERQDALAEMRRQATSTKRGTFAAFFAAPQVNTGLAMYARPPDPAARRTVQSVLAVERYRRAHQGTPPPSLDALVPAFLPAVPEDPFGDKPLVYRRDTDAYVIYSLDTNRRDDGGAFYGHGAAVAKHVGPQSPRDLGIHVPLTPQRH